MLPASASVLEENIDRVVDSVLRNISAGREAVPDLGAVEITTPFDRKGQSPEEARDEADDEARETLADLYGHVAYALKSLDAAPHALATYKAPEPPVTVPTLNLIR